MAQGGVPNADVLADALAQAAAKLSAT
jgi:hypothetical protein